MPSTSHLSHLPHLSDSLRQELMIINSFLRLRASDEAFRTASDIEFMVQRVGQVFNSEINCFDDGSRRL